MVTPGERSEVDCNDEATEEIQHSICGIDVVHTGEFAERRIGENSEIINGTGATQSANEDEFTEERQEEADDKTDVFFQFSIDIFISQ